MDEKQHFSGVRINRILENHYLPWHPLYPAYFWEQVLPRLQAKPYRDLDPPYRDEARAYRDEMRERLPVLYGLQPTIRLDEFTLKSVGVDHVADMVHEILNMEACSRKLEAPGRRGR